MAETNVYHSDKETQSLAWCDRSRPLTELDLMTILLTWRYLSYRGRARSLSSLVVGRP